MDRPALLAHDLVRTLRGRRVLDGVSLTVAPGRRIGLIGENGAGKSTLLRILAGVDEPDSGTVVRPAGLGFLHQEMPYDGGATLADVLDDALGEARADLAALDRLAREIAAVPEDAPGHGELLARYAACLERAEERESWDAERRAGLVLDGLGIGGLAHGRTLGSLSGGQRGRLALAGLLVRRPTALLLDEPTNHLDDEATAFLERRLCEMPGAVVVAGHDRAFLDAVCTDVIDLDPAVRGPVHYGGGYTAYQDQRRAARESWQRRHEEEEKELAALRGAVEVTAHRVAPDRGPRDNEKMGYGHSGGRVQHQIARRVRNAARRLDELQRRRVPAPPEPLRFRTPEPAPVPPATEPADDTPLLSLREIRVPGRLALDRLDLRAGHRLLVTGPNGAGKSTLLAVVAGTLPAPCGRVRRKEGLRTGLLAQDTVFEQPDRTVAQTYALALGEERAERVPLASLGLLAARDLDSRVGELSAGQRRRLALALLVADPPDLLLLDEPTNHLSPRLADELEEALGTGPGTVVVASHDRWLRSRWPGTELRLAAPAGPGREKDRVRP
ncbi:ABC-F family ATP-binding cassette domain-containing protein [Streptomyces sp. AM 2-1-1]|uniref:ABC-F family ATP-binding cassette domain-containing protein n=1 Tax=Streptomyces sp. AM 2-1-1 TaxID=3028709 RepID=UPI0023B8997A|nr:ABC-F family ATP-binding cassette domain-containing protein [Streptomyces sp. AM 2-1-1]WEH43323.1 ABC-F family ATP-binding cassette domain-containing protein [Streptomyces sp. AM 2-1-1]